VIGEASDGEEACRLYDQTFARHPDSGPPDAKKNGLEVVTDSCQERLDPGRCADLF